MSDSGSSYHHGDLRRALLDAARRAIDEPGGADALSLRGLATEVGVSHAAPYHHFPGKGALLAALAGEGFRELTAAMRRRTDEAPPKEALRETGVAYVRFAVENPGLFRLMFGGKLADKREHPELRAAGRGAVSALIRALDPASGTGGEVQAERRLDPDALRPWALVHGLASLLLEGQLGPVPTPEEAEAVAYRVLRV